MITINKLTKIIHISSLHRTVLQVHFNVIFDYIKLSVDEFIISVGRLFQLIAPVHRIVC